MDLLFFLVIFLKMANQSYFDRKERKILAADTTAGISSQKGNWNRKYLETAN